MAHTSIAIPTGETLTQQFGTWDTASQEAKNQAILLLSSLYRSGDLSFEETFLAINGWSADEFVSINWFWNMGEALGFGASRETEWLALTGDPEAAMAVPHGWTYNGDETWTDEAGAVQTWDGTVFSGDDTGGADPSEPPIGPAPPPGYDEATWQFDSATGVYTDPAGNTYIWNTENNTYDATAPGVDPTDPPEGPLPPEDDPLGPEDPNAGLTPDQIADLLEQGVITLEQAMSMLSQGGAFDERLGSFDDIFRAHVAPFLPALASPGQDTLLGTSPNFLAGFNLQGFGEAALGPDQNFPTSITQFLQQGGQPLGGFDAFQAMQQAGALFRDFQAAGGTGGIEQFLEGLGVTGDQLAAMLQTLNNFFIGPESASAANDLQLGGFLSPFQAQLSPFVAPALTSSFDFLQDQFNSEVLQSGNPTAPTFAESVLTPGSIFEELLAAFQPDDLLGGFDFFSPTISP